jgi:hypothetical protein
MVSVNLTFIFSHLFYAPFLFIRGFCKENAASVGFGVRLIILLEGKRLVEQIVQDMNVSSKFERTEDVADNGLNPINRGRKNLRSLPATEGFQSIADFAALD